ncbi:MAG: class II aldolase/adducin family protein [Rectinemataceae bacterium]
MNKKEHLDDSEVKLLICDIGARMYNKGFVAANDGNITIRVGEDRLWITPTGISKSLLKPEMLLQTDMEGNVIQGTGKPTSELAMHLRVYKENPEVISTCHSHSPFALAFACAGVEPDKAIAPEPMVLVGPVKIAPFAFPGTTELADSIAPFCKNNKVVLLANHGSLTWGTTPIEAWYRMEALEAYCKIVAILEFLPFGSRLLGEDQIEKIMSHPGYGVEALGRHKGVMNSTNMAPGIPLSSISSENGIRVGLGWMSANFIDELARRIADKLVARIG